MKIDKEVREDIEDENRIAVQNTSKNLLIFLKKNKRQSKNNP